MESPFALLVSLPERLGGPEAVALTTELDARLHRDQPCLIFDFSHVKQIDMDGLDMLLRCMTRIAKNDGAVQLGDVSPEAATMLELVRMDGVLDLFPRLNSENATVVRFVPAEPWVEEVQEEQRRVEEPQPLAA